MASLEETRATLDREFNDAVSQFMEGNEEALATLGVPTFSLAEKLTNQAFADLQSTVDNATYFDAAWEVIPLVAARGIAGTETWGAIVEDDSPAAAVDAFLRGALADDEKCRDALHLLGNASALSAETRDDLVRHLATATASEDFGAMVRWLAQAFQPATHLHGETHSWKPAVPAPAVVTLIASLGARLAPEATTAYDPMALTGEVLAALARKLPAVHAQGATKQYADLLANNLANRCSGIEELSLEISSSLSETAAPGIFDLVTSILPCNEGEWSSSMPEADDPRWQFGMPPRNKANLAWLQHAFALRAPGGFAVLAVANAALHESRGSEPTTRAALIASGCVRAAIALPGRIFDDKRAPMSVIVLGDRRENPLCETLFINLLNQGVDRPANEIDGHHAPRLLSQDLIDEIAETVAFWISDGTVDPPTYARIVPQAEIVAQNVLTPWTYVA